jgi:hypothetical protein
MATENDEGFIDPLALGHWDGDEFHFDEPFTTTDEDGNPLSIRVLHTEFATLQDGITKQDVVNAIVNSVHVVARHDS